MELRTSLRRATATKWRSISPKTDPATRTDRVILVDRMDGAPLGPEKGPFQLVVEGDFPPGPRGAHCLCDPAIEIPIFPLVEQSRLVDRLELQRKLILRFKR
jgi:hypothetical protein